MEEFGADRAVVGPATSRSRGQLAVAPGKRDTDNLDDDIVLTPPGPRRCQTKALWLSKPAGFNDNAPQLHRKMEQEMPESRNKYLYERLGDHDFQQLVNALLTQRFNDYQPLPLRQADGGRDGVEIVPGKTLVYQVKWSATGLEKSPVSWLSSIFRTEEQNLRRLASEGVDTYILVTNIASTGRAKTGTFDVLNDVLDKFAKSVGLRRMTCLWREALNGMVDSSPNETKWAYADMLAGWDLIRYLISDHAQAGRDSGLRDLLQKVTAVQWVDDERVKFSQADVDRQKVSDLFVDIAAQRLRTPTLDQQSAYPRGHLGGTAKYLMHTDFPFTLVRGAPGQGKSTLSQYVCQVHRVAFMPKDTAASSFPVIKDPRFPVRLDLGDYAAWISGVDVFESSVDDETPVRRGKKRNSTQRSIEYFLADFMSYSGGSRIDARDVQDLLERVPTMVVLDGLDEVAGAAMRRAVVDEIDRFCSRGRTYSVPPRVVVTTRPSASELPEPSADYFEVLSLEPMAPALRAEYIRRWCAVRGIIGREGRRLRLSYHARIKEPYIGELAGNAMQLTILLDLLHQQGEATPTQRTALYDAYMDLLLAREANKHPASVRKHRSDLLEIIPFLGWYIQSRSEEKSLRGRMGVPELKAAMKHFQQTYGKSQTVVDELFEATTDRLWALTSKEVGTFEFEVLSLREYFAAQFLYKYAGEGDRQFDRVDVFRELLRRPYWLNTVRFYGGNAVGSDIYSLAAGLRDEVLSAGGRHTLVAAWTLLTDAVFISRPREAQEVLDLICGDSYLEMLLDALDLKEIQSLPDVPCVDGRNATWERLTERITVDPANCRVGLYVRTLRELLGREGEFASWWVDQATAAVGSERESVWLKVAADHGAANGRVSDLGGIRVTDLNAQLILNTGVVPPTDSELEAKLLRAVLDGHCPETTSVRSMPAQIAAALAPARFCNLASPDSSMDPSVSQLRTRAISSLRRSGSPFATIASLGKFRKGEARSTFPLANAAAALFDEVGRCWLVSEIAIIGAASSLLLGFRKVSGASSFGLDCHPTALMASCRYNARSSEWWVQKIREEAGDELARAEWSFALWAIASALVIVELIEQWEAVLMGLSVTMQNVVVGAAERASGLVRDRVVLATAAQTGIGRRLLELRGREPDGLKYRMRDQDALEMVPLAVVARQKQWLKVDSEPSYN